MSSPIFIHTQAEFERVAERLNHFPAIAIDTEFDNNHYAYGFTLCLFQVATSDACYLIDPFEVKDLSALWRVIENPAVEKVIHDSGEDFRLLYLHGCSPRNIFDTSVATKLLCFEKIGLASVLGEVLGIESSKKKQQSNWLKRPLSDMQLDYAANDVIYLLELRDRLTERLQQQGRWEWFQQSMAFLENKSYVPKTRNTFLSPKEQRDFSPFDQHILSELYRFRDEQARRFGKPTYQILTDAQIHQILIDPTTLTNWLQLKGLNPRMQTPWAVDQLKQVIHQAKAEGTKRQLLHERVKPSPQEFAEMQQRAARSNALREGTFLPIKRWIEEKYGSLFVPYILSNEVISTLIGGELKLTDIGPSFQQAIIREAASALSIDISAFG